MARIGIARAAFAGVTVFSHRPRAALGWALIAVVFGMVRQPLKVWARTPAVGDMALWANLGSLVLALAMTAIVGAAVVRGIVRPDPAAARLRLGRDEAWFFVLMLQFVPVLVVFSLLFVALSASFEALKIGVADVGVAVLVSLGVTALGAMALHARLCLAAPMSIAQGRPRLRGSWGLTRGHAWPIVGALLLAGLLALVVSAIGGALIGIAEFMLIGHVARISTGATLAMVLTPGGLAVGALQGLLALLFVVIQAAPAAMIHRDLTGVTPADQAAVFD